MESKEKTIICATQLKGSSTRRHEQVEVHALTACSSRPAISPIACLSHVDLFAATITIANCDNITQSNSGLVSCAASTHRFTRATEVQTFARH
jgi:hypothetical protein